jgi:hypothetical protein
MSNHEDGQAVPDPQAAKNQPEDEQSQLWMNALLKEPSASSAPILELNIEEYLSDFDEFDMTEEQKIELLQTLWNMMSQFVALGFELETPKKNCAQGKLDSSADSCPMVK